MFYNITCKLNFVSPKDILRLSFKKYNKERGINMFAINKIKKIYESLSSNQKKAIFMEILILLEGILKARCKEQIISFLIFFIINLIRIIINETEK